MSAIDITGVVTASPSTSMVEVTPPGSEANYEAPAHDADRRNQPDGGGRIALHRCRSGHRDLRYGGTPIDAVRDLAQAQKEHREVLEAQEMLSPALEEQLRYLQRR